MRGWRGRLVGQQAGGEGGPEGGRQGGWWRVLLVRGEGERDEPCQEGRAGFEKEGGACRATAARSPDGPVFGRLPAPSARTITSPPLEWQAQGGLGGVCWAQPGRSEKADARRQFLIFFWQWARKALAPGAGSSLSGTALVVEWAR